MKTKLLKMNEKIINDKVSNIDERNYLPWSLFLALGYNLYSCYLSFFLIYR